MTPEELEIIKNSLPVGYIDELVLRTGFCRGYISQVLNGKRNNLSIIDASITLGKEENDIKDARKNAIEKLKIVS